MKDKAPSSLRHWTFLVRHSKFFFPAQRHLEVLRNQRRRQESNLLEAILQIAA